MSNSRAKQNRPSRRLTAVYRRGFEDGRRAALEAALSAAEPVGYLVPRGDVAGPDNEYYSFCEDQGSAAAEADIYDKGYFPIYSAPPAPSLAVKALLDGVWNAAVEKAADIANDCVHLTPDPGAAIKTMLSGRAKLHPLSDAALSAQVRDVGYSSAIKAIAAERARQIEKEGWSPEHDDEHTDGSLALAAGSYCESAARPKILARKSAGAFAIPKLWPQSWSRDWWKPKSPREDLVRAAALIIAEIERIDRAAKKD